MYDLECDHGRRRGREDCLGYDPDQEVAACGVCGLDTIVQIGEGTASGLAAGEMQNVREVRPQREQGRRGEGYPV